MELKGSKNKPQRSLTVCVRVRVRVHVTFISLNLSLTEAQRHKPDDCQKRRAGHTSGHLQTHRNKSRNTLEAGFPTDEAVGAVCSQN